MDSGYRVPLGPGWTAAEAFPGPDPLLRRTFAGARWAFMRKDSDGFLLAWPLSLAAPFPLPPLFCFARAEHLAGRMWWVFAFDKAGKPRLGPTGSEKSGKV